MEKDRQYKEKAREKERNTERQIKTMYERRQESEEKLMQSKGEERLKRPSPYSSALRATEA